MQCGLSTDWFRFLTLSGNVVYCLHIKKTSFDFVMTLVYSSWCYSRRDWIEYAECDTLATEFVIDYFSDLKP